LHFAAVDVREATAGRRRTNSTADLQESPNGYPDAWRPTDGGFSEVRKTFTEREPISEPFWVGFSAKPQAATACGLAVLG